jgi:hypothetical protein
MSQPIWGIGPFVESQLLGIVQTREMAHSIRHGRFTLWNFNFRPFRARVRIRVGSAWVLGLGLGLGLGVRDV